MKHFSRYKSLIGLFASVAILIIIPSLYAGSFISSSEDLSEPAGARDVISIFYLDEWEPGLPRQVRQIAIDDAGFGQVADRVDDVLLRLATFNHQSTSFSDWDYKSASALDSLYMSSEFADQGLIVEGNPESNKFFFVYPDNFRIIDTEPTYEKTPDELNRLSRQLKSLSSQTQMSALAPQYFMARPVSAQQSRSILERFPSLPAVADVSKVLSQSQRTALDRPTWLVEMSVDHSDRIKSVFGIDHERRFFYARTPHAMVMKMEFVSTR